MHCSTTDLISLTGVTILSPLTNIHGSYNNKLQFSGDTLKPFISLIHSKKLPIPTVLTLLLADGRFLNNGYGVSFPEVKQMGLGIDNPPPLLPRLCMDTDISLYHCTFITCYMMTLNLLTNVTSKLSPKKNTLVYEG
jgi:hypothetical protein